MADITTWFQLGTIGMVLGTLALAYMLRRVPREHYRQGLMLVAVGAIAAVAYALMAVDVGSVETMEGQTVFVVRYVDWLLTTPLHVAYLCLLAGVSRRYLAEAAVLQGATIALGLVGSLLAPPWSWLLFVAGSLTFARVLHLLYGRITDAIRANREEMAGLFRMLLNFIAVLWLVYPVIWVLGPPGLGLLDLETQSMVVSYIDVVAKIGFGLIALNGVSLAAYLSEDEPATGETALGD